MQSRIVNWMTDRAERLLGCKIYRDSLPRGTDVVEDLRRAVGTGGVRVVFDVGANIGQTAELYAKGFPNADVYSFEPVASTFRTMSERVRRFPRVRPLQLALGNSVGEADIFIDAANPTMNSLKADRGGTRERVRCSTVDATARELLVDGIDVLKIDVEGFELEVLEGARELLSQHRVGFLFVECAMQPSQYHFVPFSRFNDLLFPMGYSLFGIYEQQQYWDGRKDLMFFNAMYISPKLT